MAADAAGAPGEAGATLMAPGPSGHTLVAGLDLATLELTWLQTLPGEADRCLASGADLVCRHGVRVWVWRL
jgi:hypothetical protein